MLWKYQLGIRLASFYIFYQNFCFAARNVNNKKWDKQHDRNFVASRASCATCSKPWRHVGGAVPDLIQSQPVFQ